MNKNAIKALYLPKTERKYSNLQLYKEKQVDQSIMNQYTNIKTSRKKIRTQQNYDSVVQDMAKNINQKNNDFSKQYQMLVNKLKLNLNRNLSKKKSTQMILQKQSFYLKQSPQNRFQKPKINTFSQKQYNISYKSQKNSEVQRKLNFDPKLLNAQSLQKDQKRKIYRYFPSLNQTEGKSVPNNVQESTKNNRFYSQNKKEKRYTTDIASQSHFNKKIVNEETFSSQKKTRIKSMSDNLIQQIEQKQEQLKKLKKRLKKNVKSNKKYLSMITQQQQKQKRSAQLNKMLKQSIPQHLQAFNQNQLQQMNEINQDYKMLDELCLHLKVLIEISEQITNVKNNKEDIQQLSLLLKKYVLGNRHLIDLNNVLTDSISHLELIYKSQENKNMLKRMVFYERILIIFIIDLIFNHQLNKYINEVQQILHSIIGIYLYCIYIFKKIKGQLSQFSEQSLTFIQKKVIQSNIHMKKQLYCNNIFLTKKMQILFQSNKIIGEQITILMIEFERRKVSINRSFYELLKLYAINLNNNESMIEKNYNCLKTFATCPSPYLIQPSKKTYSLVLDLDETLIHTSNTLNKMEIFMRPYLKQFLKVISSHYEIIIFTSSMPQYSQSIINQLPFVQHKLYRYHTTRLKNRHLKDLNRLGRQLSKTVIIDNDEQNFILQKDNGIAIAPWTGSNKKDQQLNIIGLFLIKLVQSNIQDVREYVTTYQQFRKRYY